MSGEINSELPASATTRQDVLSQARAAIYGDREQTYGTPDKNLKTIAVYWSNHLRATRPEQLKNITLTADDVCAMMILLNAARLANSPKHEDSLVDICGYAALADRIHQL